MVGNTFLSSCGKSTYIWIGLLVSRMCSYSCCRFQWKYALCHSDETLKDLSTYLHAITARAVLGSHSWKFWNFCLKWKEVSISKTPKFRSVRSQGHRCSFLSIDWVSNQRNSNLPVVIGGSRRVSLEAQEHGTALTFPSLQVIYVILPILCQLLL